MRGPRRRGGFSGRAGSGARSSVTVLLL